MSTPAAYAVDPNAVVDLILKPFRKEAARRAEPFGVAFNESGARQLLLSEDGQITALGLKLIAGTDRSSAWEKLRSFFILSRPLCESLHMVNPADLRKLTQFAHHPLQHQHPQAPFVAALAKLPFVTFEVLQSHGVARIWFVPDGDFMLGFRAEAPLPETLEVGLKDEPIPFEFSDDRTRVWFTHPLSRASEPFSSLTISPSSRGKLTVIFLAIPYTVFCAAYNRPEDLTCPQCPNASEHHNPANLA